MCAGVGGGGRRGNRGAARLARGRAFTRGATGRARGGAGARWDARVRGVSATARTRRETRNKSPKGTAADFENDARRGATVKRVLGSRDRTVNPSDLEMTASGGSPLHESVIQVSGPVARHRRRPPSGAWCAASQRCPRRRRSDGPRSALSGIYPVHTPFPFFCGRPSLFEFHDYANSR